MAITKTTSGTHDQVEGKIHQVKGAIKEGIGKATNNPNLRAEGTAEKVRGKVEETVGKIKKSVK
jgi:uncharacterized protein YjbJ (UPF0337 family)